MNYANAQEYLTAHIAFVDSRIAKDKNASNVRNLQDYRKKINDVRLAEVMMKLNVACDFVVSSRNADAQFNVHSLKRVAELARLFANNETVSHMNAMFVACIRSVFNLSAHDIDCNAEDFRAACSLECNAFSAEREKLIERYTTTRASASTASAQTSMNVNALQVFNIIKRVSSMSRTHAYRVNYDSEATKLLASKLSLKMKENNVTEDAETEATEETTKTRKRKRS